MKRGSLLDKTGLLFATAFVAFLPTYVALSSSVNNDVMVVLCSTMCLYVLLSPADTWNLTTALFAGCWAGAALLSKSNAVILLPLIALRVYHVAGDRPVHMLRLGALTLLGVGVAILMLLLRNLYQYGDMLVFAPREPKEFSFSPSHVLWALRNLGWSFWFALGRTYDIRPSVSVFVVTTVPMMIVAFIGWVHSGIHQQNRHIVYLTGTAIVAGVLASLFFTLSYPAGHQTSWGKNLYPAIVFIAFFFIQGWRNFHVFNKNVVHVICLLVMVAGCLWGLWAITHV
jgi:hypothetical protein